MGAICKSNPLSEPIEYGSDETTLILYLFPKGALAGIVADIFAGTNFFNVPIVVGFPNDPEESESWAVKMFPKLNGHVEVNGMVSWVPPLQNIEEDNDPVVMVDVV